MKGLSIIFFVVCAFFAACVVADDPNIPTWPMAFSATMFIRDDKARQPELWRYFYSSVAQAERFDTLRMIGSETYFVQVYADFKGEVSYNLIFEDSTVTCNEAAMNASSMPKPDFSQFTYMGTSVVFYRPCNHWFFQDKTNGIVAEYYDTADDNRIPVRFIETDDKNGRREINFMEFDRGDQDPSVFEIPKVISDICNMVN